MKRNQYQPNEIYSGNAIDNNQYETRPIRKGIIEKNATRINSIIIADVASSNILNNNFILFLPLLPSYHTAQAPR